MKPKFWFPAFFLAIPLLLLGSIFTGCYTHLATGGGGYYTYYPRPVYSDTMRGNAALSKPLVTYDTTMHGDTMFIDEHQAAASPQADGLAEGIAPNENAGTIVNNYYGSGYGSASYWDSYWGPSWGFSVGVGWPYYQSWYSPWWPYYYTPNYYSDWYSPYGYFGAYPPLYDAYSPFYSYGYYRPHYYGGFGYHHFHNGFYGGGYAYSNIQPGRVGGELRAGQASGRVTTPGGIIANSTPPSTGIARSNFAEDNALKSNVAQSQAADVLRSAEDRNAPVHVLSPDAASVRTTAAQSEPLGNSTAPASNVNGRAVAASALASTSSNSHPIVVRRMDNGQTVTTMSRAGRQMVVVRRSAGYSGSSAYRGYSPSYRGNGSSSRGYAPSTRSGGNNGSYNAPARNDAPSARSYSPPERSYSPPERSSAPAESGRSSGGGGGSAGRAGGGGEARGR